MGSPVELREAQISRRNCAFSGSPPAGVERAGGRRTFKNVMYIQ